MAKKYISEKQVRASTRECKFEDEYFELTEKLPAYLSSLSTVLMASKLFELYFLRI
jgi:hypothetical protein